MIICYLRSSSYNAFDICEFSYFLNYCLGIKDKSGKAADKGNICHKGLELLAARKLAEQNKQKTVTDDECGKTWKVKDLTPEFALQQGWDLYTTRSTHHEWKNADYNFCKKCFNNALTFQNGIFNPLNRKIIAPEGFFDFTIDKPWANYEVVDPFSGQTKSGQLSVRGSIDLVTELEDGVLELIDWKTGAMKDWSTGGIKSFKSLMKDFQLLLYYYALRRTYTQYKTIMVTINFCQFNKYFTLPFTDYHLQELEDKIRIRFEQIKKCVKPKRIIDIPSKKFWCKNVCYYGKNKFEGTENMICDHIHSHLHTLGLDRVMKQFGDPKAAYTYTGGGKSNKDVT